MSDKQPVKSFSFFTAGVITTISITLVLFLLGLTFLLGFTGRGFTSYLKENMAVSIELPDKVDEASVSRIQKDLAANAYVRSTTYISKEEIKKQLIEDLGRDPEEVLGYNPAHGYIDVYIKSQYVNNDSIKKVEASLKGIKSVNNIVYSEDDISMANSNLSKVGTILLLLAFILIVISFTLIRNTIQLNIYAKRFLINTMRLVGATNSFIRKPFITNMVVCGIIAAVLANMMITAVVYYLVKEYPDLILMVRNKELLAVYFAVLALGVVITVTATIASVNKYLRMTSNKLYHI